MNHLGKNAHQGVRLVQVELDLGAEKHDLLAFRLRSRRSETRPHFLESAFEWFGDRARTVRENVPYAARNQDDVPNAETKRLSFRSEPQPTGPALDDVHRSSD